MKGRALGRKLGISLLSLVLLLVLVELGARLAEPGPFSLIDRRPYQEHDELPHVHVPGFHGRWDGTWYDINSEGLRGPEFEPTFERGEFRVLAVGDSCTFGKGVLERESWPRLLERELARTLGPGFRPMVANLGVNGFNGTHYLQRIRTFGPRWRPDLVIVGYNINDFPNVVQAIDYQVFQGEGDRRPSALRSRLERLASFRWLRQQFYALNRERDWKASEEIAAEVRRNAEDRSRKLFAKEIERIGEIAAECRALGAELVVFLVPHEGQVHLENYDRSAVDWLAGACARHDVTFLDLIEPFRRVARERSGPSLFLRGDRYHPDAEGYTLVADGLLRLVREQGWLPEAP